MKLPSKFPEWLFLLTISLILAFSFAGCLKVQPPVPSILVNPNAAELNPVVYARPGESGIRLRDQFAGQCVTGLAPLVVTSKLSPEAASKHCYILADRMLMQRIKP